MRARRALLLFLATLVAVAAAVLVSTARPPAPTPSPIARITDVRIVVSLPRAGARRVQTEGIVSAVRLAIAEVDGRVSGPDGMYRVEAVVADSARDGAWSDAAERANADAAVADPRVIAYIGPGTVEGAKLVASLAAKADLAVVTPTLTHPALTKPGYDDAVYDAAHRVIARVIPPDDVAVKALLRWAKDTGRVPTSLVAADDSAYATMLAVAYRKALDALALQDSPAPKLAFLAGSSPDALGERATKLGGASAGGSEILLSDAFLAKAGKSADGAVAFFVGRPVEAYGGRAGAFLRAYQGRYAVAPDPYAIYGYEAARLALEGVRRGGGDRAKARAAIFSATDVAGALGTWSVDANGDFTYATLQRYVARSRPDGRIAWFWDGEMTP